MTQPEPISAPPAVAAEGDLVLMVAEDGKRVLVQLQRGGQWHTHRGLVRHDDILDRPLGHMVVTQLGHAFLVLEPSTHDLIRYIKRSTQIIFPKDAAYIVQRLNLFPGRRIVEAGTGSGGLTIALARAVMPHGRVYSYEERQKMSNLAARNLERVGLQDYVDLRVQDISAGFTEREVDSCFLDLREPWLHLDQARATLKDGGFFGSLLPTTNQVSALLEGLQDHGFADLVVEELLVRSYKPIAERLRPSDRMVAHTGYLVFARKASLEAGETWRIVDAKRYKARPVDEDGQGLPPGSAEADDEEAGDGWHEPIAG